MSRYYLDTEFNERGPDHPIELISLGLVRDDGASLSFTFSDGWVVAHASHWLVENVLPHLPPTNTWVTRAYARDAIEAFLAGDDRIEFYGYYSAYDWVLFCQLWGRMIDLPKSFPHYCNDVKQLAKNMGFTGDLKQFEERELAKHEAVSDARQIRRYHNGLRAWFEAQTPTSWQAVAFRERERCARAIRSLALRTRSNVRQVVTVQQHYSAANDMATFLANLPDPTLDPPLDAEGMAYCPGCSESAGNGVTHMPPLCWDNRQLGWKSPVEEAAKPMAPEVDAPATANSWMEIAMGERERCAKAIELAKREIASGEYVASGAPGRGVVHNAAAHIRALPAPSLEPKGGG
jgi:hypothetical protein